MALEVLVRGGPFPVNDKPPKYPLGMLSTHVLFKGAQAGSVLGVVLSTPYVHDPNGVCCIRRARRASMAQALPSHHPPGRSVTAGTTCGLTCVASGHFFVVLAERLPFQWYVDMQRGWARRAPLTEVHVGTASCMSTAWVRRSCGGAADVQVQLV